MHTTAVSLFVQPAGQDSVTETAPEVPKSAQQGLLEGLRTHGASEDVSCERFQRIRQAVLNQSRHIRTANFTTIHTDDLQFLLKTYDEGFFSGLINQAMAETPIRFRLSTRMTSAGGKTARFRNRSGDVSYEIAIAGGLLFQGFGEQDRGIRVCGLECESRLDALMHIFEHELVHLIEFLCWGVSDCSGSRFQNIATRHFMHRTHTHELITWKERALNSGIRRGARVAFDFEGRRLHGRVSRITKRATVLVEDPQGLPYSDGRRYRTYYVPIRLLEPASATPAIPCV